MKKLSPKPNSPIVSLSKKPLVIGTALIGSMNACMIQEPDVGETAYYAGSESAQPAGIDVVGSFVSGSDVVGEPPPAGDEDFIGAGDPNAYEYDDMFIPLDIGLYESDQGGGGSEVNDMLVPTDPDFGLSDMGPIEADAALVVGLPPEPDPGGEEPGGEEP